MKIKRNPLSLLIGAISAMLGRTQAPDPKTPYVNRPPLAVRPRPISRQIIPITENPASFQKSNQNKVRKNRRRAFAAGESEGFCIVTMGSAEDPTNQAAIG